MKYCEKCHTGMSDHAQFCPQCGAPAQDKKESGIQKCPYCNEPIKDGTLFCPSCGKRLAPTPEPIPSPKYYQLKGGPIHTGIIYAICIFDIIFVLVIMKEREWYGISFFVVLFSLIFMGCVFAYISRKVLNNAVKQTDLAKGAELEKDARTSGQCGMTMCIVALFLCILNYYC